MKNFIKRNAVTILTCMGGAGVILTAVTAVKDTPKALKKLDEAKTERGEDLTNIEKIKVVGPVYIPAVLIGVGTISCIIGAKVISKRSQAALFGAYTLIDSSYKEYKHKLKELYGEETHQKIVDAIAVEKVDPNWTVRGSYICDSCDITSDDSCSEPVLFYEEHSNRYFMSTIEQVINAEYHLNRNYVLRGATTLNELYDFLGLEPTEYGDVLGWAPTDEGECWVEFNHRKTVLTNGVEGYVIEMPFEPTYEPWNY